MKTAFVTGASRGIGRATAGRLVRPDEIADTVAYLCSPGADMIRGQVVVIDGAASLLV